MAVGEKSGMEPLENSPFNKLINCRERVPVKGRKEKKKRRWKAVGMVAAAEPDFSSTLWCVRWVGVGRLDSSYDASWFGVGEAIFPGWHQQP